MNKRTSGDDYVSREWYALFDELIAEGYTSEEAEMIADEEMGYRLSEAQVDRIAF